LERKWPGKYNAVGHLSWGGRVYNARGLTPLWWRRGRIYQGTWGMAPYQRLYQPASTLMGELPLLPEWYLIIAFFAALSLIGVLWKPLLAVIPFLLIAAGLSILQALVNAVVASSCGITERKGRNWRALWIGLLLHMLQPLARLTGRLKYGLHPWRRRGVARPSVPRSRTVSLWSEVWRSPDEWLRLLQERLKGEGTPGVAGGDYDDWDLEIQAGVLGGVRTRMAVEEHGAGKQLLRFRIWPRFSLSGLFMSVLMLCLAVAAGYDRAGIAAGVLGGAGLVVAWRMFLECSLAVHQLQGALGSLETQVDGAPQSAAPRQAATVTMSQESA
jgi:hypothetical protein